MEHKARVVFTDDVWKQIEWFTYNFKTEIGALGIVKRIIEDGETHFRVEKLLFPQQKVTGATVHFTPEMWGDLLKERGLEGLKDVAFYWHRHPGSSAHSGTDDVDTFETFMSKEANRKYFIFLQTAVGTDGWNQEARIDARQPVRHTITNEDIEIEVEESLEEEELRARCEAIAKKCVVVEPVKTYTATYYGNGYNAGTKKNSSLWDSFKSVIPKEKQSTLETDIETGTYGNIEGQHSFNNDILQGYSTTNDEKVDISFENGQATIITGTKFGTILENVLTKKADGKLLQYVRSFKKGPAKYKYLTKYNLQPMSGKYYEMRDSLIKGYFMFCNKILEDLNSGINYVTSAIEDKETIEYNKQYDPYTDETMDIVGIEEVKDALFVLEADCILDWDSIYNATIMDMEGAGIIGEAWLNDEKNKLIVKGNGAIWVLKAEEECLRLQEEERKEEEQ